MPGATMSTLRENPGLSWDTPIWHPAVRPAGYGHLVPVPGTICDPQCLGLDPDTGAPLTLRLWDPHAGGNVVAVTTGTGGGQSTLLDSVRERITACPDARLLQVSLTRALDARRWAPLAAAAALGDEDARAALILQFAADTISARAVTAGPARVHRPTAGAPLYVLEIARPGPLAAHDPDVRHLLARITAGCPAGGVAVLLAAPRFTAGSLGGADVMSRIDVAVTGPSCRPGLPGLDGYGTGMPGVFGIYEPPSAQFPRRGRAFCWDDPAGAADAASAVVEARLAAHRRHQLEPALARLQPRWDQITTRRA
jgi:hypothetical protein